MPARTSEWRVRSSGDRCGRALWSRVMAWVASMASMQCHRSPALTRALPTVCQSRAFHPLDPGRCVVAQILQVGDDLHGAGAGQRLDPCERCHDHRPLLVVSSSLPESSSSDDRSAGSRPSRWGLDCSSRRLQSRSSCGDDNGERLEDNYGRPVV